jgi:hypothetical protein
MTSNPPDYPPEYWRERAKELREQARTMKDPELRREVEIIAEVYERLADHVARREHAEDDGERRKPGAAKLSALMGSQPHWILWSLLWPVSAAAQLNLLAA